MHRRLLAGLLLAVAYFVIAAPAFAEDTISLIAQQRVHRGDVVEARKGNLGVVGSPACGSADAKTGIVHWFQDMENSGVFADNPGKFPPTEGYHLVALHGADPVALFPNGVHDPVPGQVVAGDPKFATYHGGATIWFSSATNMATFFMKGGDQFIATVGNYCLGAMARENGDVVHGNPNYALFIPEAGPTGTWAVFGSENGPIAWSKMTPAERRAAYEHALANYRRKTGTEGPPRISMR